MAVADRAVTLLDAAGNVISGASAYTVDGAVPAAPSGNAVLVARDDALATLAEADNDWTILRSNNKGALWAALSDTAGAALAYNEDDAIPAVPAGFSPMLVRKDSLATITPAVGDWTHGLVSPRGQIWTVQETAAVNNNADGVAASARMLIGSDTNVLTMRTYPYLYNSVTTTGSWDPMRGNIGFTALASASRTVSTNSSDFMNAGGVSLTVYVDMTVVGTGSITVSIQEKDPVSGVYTAMLTGAAITTNSHTIYRVGPGLTAAANAVANAFLPRTFRIAVVANNANAATFSIGCHIN